MNIDDDNNTCPDCSRQWGNVDEDAAMRFTGCATCDRIGYGAMAFLRGLNVAKANARMVLQTTIPAIFLAGAIVGSLLARMFHK